MKIKIKIYSMLLSVAMALAVVTFESCSNDEIMEVKQESCSLGDEILFHSDVLSRAVATTTGSINKIWVYAYTKNTANGNQAKEVIPGVEFTKGEDNTFISEKKYYWPENDEVCFIAFYPTPSELGIADDKILESMPEQVRTGVDDLYSYLVKTLRIQFWEIYMLKPEVVFRVQIFMQKILLLQLPMEQKKTMKRMA